MNFLHTYNEFDLQGILVLFVNDKYFMISGNLTFQKISFFLSDLKVRLKRKVIKARTIA